MAPITWQLALRIAAEIDPIPPRRVDLLSAIGSTLAEPITAFADLPPDPAATESGWAVRGLGPWTVVPHSPSEELADGCATRIPAGAVLPTGCDAVLVDRFAVVEADGRTVLVGEGGRPASRPGLLRQGFGVTNVGATASHGQVLHKSGDTFTAGTLALAAAAGADDISVHPPASVVPMLLATRMLPSGPPRRGRDRDIVRALIPAWIMAAGARSLPHLSVAAEASEITTALEAAGGDLVVISGGPEPGISIAARSALQQLRAELLIDGVTVQPGGAVLLAELPDGRRVLVLPREPNDAVVALALLLNPTLSALAARSHVGMSDVMLRDPVEPVAHARAIPVAVQPGELIDLAIPQPWHGPHGLAALASATGIGFLDAGRGQRGDAFPVATVPGRG
jgi:molybdopterin molybdotransferase